MTSTLCFISTWELAKKTGLTSVFANIKDPDERKEFFIQRNELYTLSLFFWIGSLALITLMSAKSDHFVANAFIGVLGVSIFTLILPYYFGRKQRNKAI